MTNRWRMLSISFFAAVLLTPSAWAQDYPNRTIRMIVPFGAGGPTDVFTRALGEELRKSLGQPIVMENRPGAGTIIGTTEAAKSAPDGYTLLMISATQTTVETLNPNKSYRLTRDFVPVAALMNSELVLVVPQRSPVNSLKELIALARAKPGTLNYGSSGPGSNYHMAGELIKNLAGLDIVHVPYKGSTGARADIVVGPDRHDVRQRADHGGDHRGRPRQGARHLGQGALADPSQRADHRGSRHPGIQRHHLDRSHGARRHAAGDRRPAQPRDQQDLGSPGHQGVVAAQGANTMVMKPDEFGAYIQSEIERWAKLITGEQHRHRIKRESERREKAQ